MIKRISTLYRLSCTNSDLMRQSAVLRKALLLLSFCLFSCFSFSAFGMDESPENIERIRNSLRTKVEGSTKANIATSIGVAPQTLAKFIKEDKSLTRSSCNKIIDNFKKNYREDYARFTGAAPLVSSQTQTITTKQSSQPEPIKDYPCLDLCGLPFHPSFPDTYSLFMVDSSLIPHASIGDWEQRPLFTDIGRRFLRSSLAVDENISFATIDQEAQTKNQWILQDQKIISTPNGEQKPYHIVQLFKKRKEQRTVNLIRFLTERQIAAYDGFDFQAALIIFPYPQQKAMIYGLGYWDTLLNPNCIIPQWGLRLATSGYVCNPSTIKELHADHYRTSNPFSRREKAADLQPIEAFGVEVGSEELKKVALMPNKSVKTQHVIEGADHMQFTINPSEKTTPEQTLHSLNTIALHFLTLTADPNFRIHSRMREFIDDEITDARLPLLNQYLERLFRPSQEEKKLQKAKETFFLHNTLWAKMKSKKLMFGEKEDKKHCIFDVFSQLTPQDPFPQIIKIWTPRGKTAKEFDTRWLFYSLPLEHTDGNFYRFDRGHWYRVDASRFESIKRILRQVKRPSDTMCLPNYSVEEARCKNKEARYNLKATKEIKRKEGWSAILLDKVLVSLGKAGSKFEFADLLIRHNNIFYLVHAKRVEANQLSHHREQVERSADFLATELSKENAHTLFLQGIINGLYETNKLPIKKEKKQGKRITKGNLFLNYYNSLKSQDFLSALSLSIPRIADPLLSFTSQVLQIIDNEFFKSYPLELVSALDALYDCVLYKNAHFTNPEIEEFLNTVKQGIMARQLLFPKGPLKKGDLKNIKIVLAIIDDRAIEATLKGTAQKAQQRIFNNQDLWGLDRTRTVVEKTGLGFVLTIINEDSTKTEDAFGSIIKKERKESFIDMSGDEPELFVAPYPIKAETSLSFVQAPSYSPPRDLKSLFSTVQVLSTDLKEITVQKLQYVYQNQNYELFTCPTVGDGDCFFHAAFTEPGEAIQVVQEKAANMRKQLCDAVQQGQFVNELKPLVYEHYQGLLADNKKHPEVPDDIKQHIAAKNDYVAMYNSMQRFGISVDTILKPEDRFPIGEVVALITPGQVKTYMEQFRSVGGYETYVPFRPGMSSCPVDILASLGKKRINVFTFNKEEKKLQLPKTAGTGTETVINILHRGNHFVRLYHYPSESDISFRQCEQIWANHLLYTHK